MMVTKRFFTWFLLLALCIVGASAVPELRVDTLSVELGEQFHFIACSDTQDMKVSVSCLHNASLQSVQWSSNCYVYAFETDNLTCLQPVITVSETGGETTEITTETIFLNNYRAVLESSVNLNETHLNKLASMAYIYFLLEDKDSIELILEELETKRDSDKKCWPATNCDINKTVDILYHLSKAEVDSSRRVYKDALAWVESEQHKLLNTDWKITVGANENSTCTVLADASSLAAITTDETDEYSKTFSYTPGTALNTTCDHGFCVTIFNEFSTSLYSKCAKSNENLTFRMPGPCWSNEGIDVCSPLLTTRAMQLKNLDATLYGDTKTWLTDGLTKDEVKGKRIEISIDPLTNIYAYNLTGESTLKDWVLFSQSNDGSFGNNVLATLEAVRVFSSGNNTEAVDDAKKWLLEQRSQQGWGDLEKDALMYELFSKRAPVRADPIILTEKTINFELSSSQAISLDHNITGDVLEIVSVNLSADGQIVQGTLSPDTSKDGLFNGFLLIQNASKKVPLVIRNNPSFNLLAQPKYYVFDDAGQLAISYEKSGSSVACDFEFDNVFEKFSINFSANEDLSFKYSVDKKGDHPVEGTYVCITNLNVITANFSFIVHRTKGVPFTYKIDSNHIGEDPAILKLTNELDENLSLSLSWKKSPTGYTVLDSLELGAKERGQVTIYQDEEQSTNSTDANEIVVSGVGFSVSIPLTIDLDDTPHDVESGADINGGFPWGKIILSILFLGILGGAFVARKRILALIRKPEAQPAPEAKKTQNKGPLKPRHSMALAKVLTALDESLGESKDEIRGELKQEGYDDKEIDAALSMEETPAMIREHGDGGDGQASSPGQSSEKKTEEQADDKKADDKKPAESSASSTPATKKEGEDKNDEQKKEAPPVHSSEDKKNEAGSEKPPEAHKDKEKTTGS